jgi:hypothetical protein
MRKSETERTVTELTIPRTGKPRVAEIVVSVTCGVTSIKWDSGFKPGDTGFEVLQELLECDGRTSQIINRLNTQCVRVCMTRQERIEVPAEDAAWLVIVLQDIFSTATSAFERLRRLFCWNECARSGNEAGADPRVKTFAKCT